MVFFEAPHRLARTLSAMAEAFGADRRAAVCRELTKTYEEVRRGSLSELRGVGVRRRARRGDPRRRRGSSGPVADLASQLEGIRERVAEGERLKDVCADVAAATGLSKKALYDAAVAAAAPLTPASARVGVRGGGVPGSDRAAAPQTAGVTLDVALRTGRLEHGSFTLTGVHAGEALRPPRSGHPDPGTASDTWRP